MRLHFSSELFVLLDASETRLDEYTVSEGFIILIIKISWYFMLDY
jgi:hypothetical protein